MTALKALVLGCTLKSGPAVSSSEMLGREVLTALGDHDVTGEFVRVVEANVKFGVTTDEGGGDGWPAIRDKVMASHILVIATPIWMGQPSSVCKMVLERLDAELGETDDEGRLQTSGRVAVVAVVGNEDGAHDVTAEVMQALNDVGFTVPASGVTYWVGEAMQKIDYVDAGDKPKTTGAATKQWPPTLPISHGCLRTTDIQPHEPRSARSHHRPAASSRSDSPAPAPRPYAFGPDMTRAGGAILAKIDHEVKRVSRPHDVTAE